MKNNKNESKSNKTALKENQNNYSPKIQNQSIERRKLDTKTNISKKTEINSNLNTLQSQITNFQEIIEEKDREIEKLKNENKNNISMQKQAEAMNAENKVDKIAKKLDLIKVRNDILTKNLKEKEQEIVNLNNILIEYKQKISSSEQSSDFMNEIKKNIRDENIVKQIEKYEIELFKVKNSLDESEIKNMKLVFENNILVGKIQNMEIEKNEEIKIMESLHQKQIDNYNKNIEQLYEKIAELVKEREINQKYIINKDEYINKKDIINEINKKQDKIRQLDEDNFKLKKDIQQMINKNEELTIIIKNKDLIIERLETEIERFDFNNGKESKNINENELNKESNKNREEYLIKIESLEKENEELKIGLQNMTEGINKANELYNEKLNNFNNELVLKNNKLKEYKNKISILKCKIVELSNELMLLKGGANNNSYYNASFINNSIINTNQNSNTNTIPRIKDDMMVNNNNFMLNKKYYNNYNTGRVNTDNTNMNSMNNILGQVYVNKNDQKDHNNKNQINLSNNYKSVKLGNMPNINVVNDNNNNNNSIKNSNSNINIYRNKGVLNNAKIGIKASDTQEFINKNKEEDKNHMNFLKEYKETLNKFQNFK
jgi:hypothetical protein